jgi:hypothetical protein
MTKKVCGAYQVEWEQELFKDWKICCVRNFQSKQFVIWLIFAKATLDILKYDWLSTMTRINLDRMLLVWLRRKVDFFPLKWRSSVHPRLLVVVVIQKEGSFIVELSANKFAEEQLDRMGWTFAMILSIICWSSLPLTKIRFSLSRMVIITLRVSILALNLHRFLSVDDSFVQLLN